MVEDIKIPTMNHHIHEQPHKKFRNKHVSSPYTNNLTPKVNFTNLPSHNHFEILI